MINFCKENSLTPILVTTPFLNEYLVAIDNISSDFRKSFKEQIELLSLKMNVPYYDYSNKERYVDNYKYFMNSAH